MIAFFLEAAVSAVLLHEAAHAAVARAMGARAVGVRVRPWKVAVVVDQTACPESAMLRIALAGPAMDLVLALVVLALVLSGAAGTREALALGVWPAVSCVVNLLPLQGADGSRALSCLRSRKARKAAA